MIELSVDNIIEDCLYMDIEIMPSLDLSGDKYKAIIGRDFLKYCVFVYDGANEKGYLNIIK